MQQFAQRFDGVSGSEIRKIFALLGDPEIISFAGGNPSPETFPGKELAAISNTLLAEEASWVLQYGGTPGVGEVLEYLKQKHANDMSDTDDLMMLTGSSQGIEAFTRVMLNEGDRMLVESPTFLGALQTFKLARAEVDTVTVEEDGVNLEELEHKLKTWRPKFFYIIPTFQNPGGTTTSLEKRKKIYELCKQYNTYILEDDPYAELRFEGDTLPSIQSMDDSGLVCKLFSFSKTISPGLRVGYVIAHKDIIQKMNLLKQGMDVHTANLNQAMVLEYLKSGQYEGHVQQTAGLYKKHRDAMLSVLDAQAPDGMVYSRPMGGLFIWVQLPDRVNTDELFPVAVEQKVAFVPGRTFFAHEDKTNYLRLNYSMPTMEQIQTGTERLCNIIREYM